MQITKLPHYKLKKIKFRCVNLEYEKDLYNTFRNLKISNQTINYVFKSKNDRLRGSKIGIIYQDNNLLSDFTALENIYFACLSAGNKKELAVIKQKNY